MCDTYADKKKPNPEQMKKSGTQTFILRLVPVAKRARTRQVTNL